MATLEERMKAVAAAEQAAGVHYTQTGQGATPGVYPGISPGQPAFPAMPTARPPTPAPTAPTPQPWPEMPPTEGLPPFQIPEEWMPQTTGAMPIDINMLLRFIYNTMKTETREYEDPNTHIITTKLLYSEEDIENAINLIWESVSETGADLSNLGPETPWYSQALEYYTGMAQAQTAGGGQLSPAEYLGYQLDQQQMALQQQLAMLPYQDMTTYQRAQIEQQIRGQLADIDLAQQQLKLQEQGMWLPYEQVQAGTEAQMAQERELAMLPYGQMTAYQQAAVGLEKQRYGAELAAQPKSWLEYAAFMGETPAVQPWMQPLMPQQYSQLGAGQAIPGYQGTQGMGGMPQLTTPSRQYQARMGPTAMGQYQGYQQARTGARPEETEYRLWSGAPPSGGYGGLQYTR